VAQIQKARIDYQYRTATERCELLNIPENWRLRLEQEYEDLQQTLRLWTEHRQAWAEHKEKQLHETLAHWDRLQIRDTYIEIQFKLKVQQKRWQLMLENIGDLHPVPS
jgi:stearoyl-CoA desaturase (delta-9 desaturase)